MEDTAIDKVNEPQLQPKTPSDWQTYVDKLPIPDVRGEDRDIVGESGAEALFCDTTDCKLRKNKILSMSGLKNHRHHIEGVFKDLGRRMLLSYETIKQVTIQIKDDQDTAESLAYSLGYENIHFNEKGFVITKGTYFQQFPSVSYLND